MQRRMTAMKNSILNIATIIGLIVLTVLAVKFVFHAIGLLIPLLILVLAFYGGVVFFKKHFEGKEK